MPSRSELEEPKGRENWGALEATVCEASSRGIPIIITSTGVSDSHSDVSQFLSETCTQIGSTDDVNIGIDSQDGTSTEKNSFILLGKDILVEDDAGRTTI